LTKESNEPLILTALLLAAFMINFDTTIVNVALATLVRGLRASTVQLEWSVDAYTSAEPVIGMKVMGDAPLGQPTAGRPALPWRR
jgi:MFS family permease